MDATRALLAATTEQRRAIKCEVCGRPWTAHPRECGGHARQPRRCGCGWRGVLADCRRETFGEPCCPACGRLYPTIDVPEAAVPAGGMP